MKDDALAVFVINMSSSTSRLEKITHDLHSKHFPFERIEAFDGRKLSNTRQFISRLSRLVRPNPLSANEIGCWLSHRKIWEKIIAEKIPRSLVLEDDATPLVSFEEIVAIDIDRSGLDVLRLHILEPDAALLKNKIEKIDAGISIAGREIFVQTAPVVSATAYILTLSGAHKLASRKKMLAPVDWWSLPGGLDGLLHGIVMPGMFDAKDGGVSTIGGHGMYPKTGNKWRARLNRRRFKLVKRHFLSHLDRRHAKRLVDEVSGSGLPS